MGTESLILFLTLVIAGVYAQQRDSWQSLIADQMSAGRRTWRKFFQLFVRFVLLLLHDCDEDINLIYIL